jgi:uncharacterized protein YjiS (DUF1127 family)
MATFASPSSSCPTARGLADVVAERIRNWRQQRRWKAEVADLASLGRLDDFLKDTALSRADLRYLARAPADAGTQIEVMAQIAGVDLAALPPETRREAEWVCARCACREPCKQWLRTGQWADGDDTRCPNAGLFHH